MMQCINQHGTKARDEVCRVKIFAPTHRANFNIMTAIVPTMTMVALLESKAARRLCFAYSSSRLSSHRYILSHDVGDDALAADDLLHEKCSIRYGMKPGHRSDRSTWKPQYYACAYIIHCSTRTKQVLRWKLYLQLTAPHLHALQMSAASTDGCYFLLPMQG